MRDITHIIVCDTGTEPHVELDRAAIDRRDRLAGAKQIGYHYVIYRDGTLVEGRPLEIGGNVQVGYDREGIFVCLVGKENNYTQPQMDMLEQIIGDLSEDYAPAQVVGLSELNMWENQPGFNVTEWWTSCKA